MSFVGATVRPGIGKCVVGYSLGEGLLDTKASTSRREVEVRD